MKKISVIIVSYNVSILLKKCIQSIYSFQNTNIEIIVVDNASSDDSIKMMDENFPEIKKIINLKNVGFPAANNQGLQIATGDYLLLLNPDTEIIDDAINKMLAFYQITDKEIILAPQLLNTNRTIQYSAWQFPTILSAVMNDWYLYHFFKTNTYTNDAFSNIFYPDFASGAALFFSKNVFHKIGFLDEFLFWIEDTDYCYRANKIGIKTLYNPAFKILHHIGASGKKNYKISLSNQTYNKIKFLKKNNQKGIFLLKLLTIINVVVKIMLFSCLGIFKHQAKLKAEAYAYTLPKILNPPNGIA